MSKERFYVELEGETKCFYRRHIDFPVLTFVSTVLVLMGVFSLILLFINAILFFIIAIGLVIWILILLKGEFILFAEMHPDRQVIIHDNDIAGGNLKIDIDTIKFIETDNRDAKYLKKYAYKLTAGKTVARTTQLYIYFNDGGMLVLGSKTHGGH